MPLDKDVEGGTLMVKMTIEDTDPLSPYYDLPISDSVLLIIAPIACQSSVQLESSFSMAEEGKVSFTINAESGIDFYTLDFGDGQRFLWY